MFGGHGVYSEGLCFAIQIRVEAFLKCDSQSQPSFVAAGSSPFVHNAKGRPMTTSFWRLPADAHEEPEGAAPLGGAGAGRGAPGGGRQVEAREGKSRENAGRPSGAGEID